MPRWRRARATLLWLAILLVTRNVSAEPVNVSFSEVLDLPQVQPDQSYPYGSLPLQTGELYLPVAKGNVRLVLLIHGGCWLNQFGLDHVRPLAGALQQRGMAVWSIEYRRIGDEGGGYPGTFNDIQAAANALPALKAELTSNGFQPTKTIVVGHSAGGHLALWIAATSKLFDEVIGLAAITDLAEYAAGQSSCQQAAKQLMGPQASEADYHKVSPTQLPYPNVNVNLLAGGNDAIVGGDQVNAFQRKHPATAIEILEQAGHFDFIHPDTAAVQALINILTDD